MTTPNSLGQNPPVAQPTSIPNVPPVVNPADSYAAQFDIGGDLPPLTTQPATPVVPAQSVQPAAVSHVPQQHQPAPSTQQAAQPRIPEYLVQRATEQGIPQIVIDRLDGLGLSELLREMEVRRLRESHAATTQAAIQNPNPPGQVNREAAAAAIAQQVAAPQPQVPSFDWGEWDDFDVNGQPIPNSKRKYTDADINPAIAHHIKTLSTELAEAKRMLGSIVNQATAVHEDRVTREFDDTFSQWPNVFGKGSAAEVSKTPEGQNMFQRRKMIFQSVKAMFASMPPEAASRISIKDAVNNMVKSMFSLDPPAAAAGGGQNVQQRPDYTNGTLQRPTQRTPSSKPPGPARAKESVAQWWQNQANGEGVPDDGVTTPDEFLG